MSKNTTKYLLRIKVNNFNLLQLKLINQKDFIFSIPKTNVAGQKLNTHFTFHTMNEVVTWKTDSIIKHGKELISDVIKRVELSNYSELSIPGKNKINMLYGKKFDFNHPERLINPYINLSLNLINSSMDKLFVNKSKTPDNQFGEVVNFVIPEDKTGITIESMIGKNFIGDTNTYTHNHDDFCLIRQSNYLGDQYSLLFLVKYIFPEIEASPDSIIV